MTEGVKIVYKMKPLPQNVHDKFVAIANAETIEELSKHFLCGFELETMSSFGKEYGELYKEFQEWLMGKRYNKEEVIEHIKSKADYIAAHSYILASLVNKPYITRDSIAYMGTEARLQLRRDFIGNVDTFKDRLIARLEELQLGEFINELHNAGYTIPVSREAANITMQQWLAKEKANIAPELLEGGSDGTVRGPEWRTKGGLKPEQFLEVAAKILEHPHVITEGCSFHTHLSVPGIKSQYNATIQRAMVEYLLSLRDVPERIRSRWKRKESQRNFNVKPDSGKYAFAAFNGGYGTWEFRCWGNVATFEEARYCLEQSMRAYQYQAQRYLAGGVLATTENTIGTKGQKVLDSGEPITLKYRNKDAAPPAPGAPEQNDDEDTDDGSEENSF